MKAKFSVIIPAYNSEKYIIDALRSVYNQSSLELIGEVIVINDGSTDRTKTIVEEYASNLEMGKPELFLIDKKNGGVSSARNEGVRHAKYDWIAFLDSDDEWYPDKIERQIKIINEVGEDNIDCLGGSFNGDKLNILGKKYSGLFRAKIRQICLRNFPQPSTVVIKRSVFIEVGGFDEKCYYAEDGLFFLGICNKYKLFYDTRQVIKFGHGKCGFGFSGLSKNVKEMHKGNIRNIKILKEKGIISCYFYFFLRVFYQLKYMRRILIIASNKL